MRLVDHGGEWGDQELVTLAARLDLELRELEERLARGGAHECLTSILEKIELDPARSTLQLSYRIPLRQSGGCSMASARGFKPRLPP
jgi:hypothetical protein